MLILLWLTWKRKSVSGKRGLGRAGSLWAPRAVQRGKEPKESLSFASEIHRQSPNFIRGP